MCGFLLLSGVWSPLRLHSASRPSSNGAASLPLSPRGVEGQVLLSFARPEPWTFCCKDYGNTFAARSPGVHVPSGALDSPALGGSDFSLVSVFYSFGDSVTMFSDFTRRGLESESCCPLFPWSRAGSGGCLHPRRM